MKINPFILERIKIGLLGWKQFYDDPLTIFPINYSLCACASQDERLSIGDVDRFREYLETQDLKNYNWMGEQDLDGSWRWKPTDFDSRLAWLNEHIKLNS